MLSNISCCSAGTYGRETSHSVVVVCRPPARRRILQGLRAVGRGSGQDAHHDRTVAEQYRTEVAGRRWRGDGVGAAVSGTGTASVRHLNGIPT